MKNTPSERRLSFSNTVLLVRTASSSSQSDRRTPVQEDGGNLTIPVIRTGQDDLLYVTSTRHLNDAERRVLNELITTVVNKDLDTFSQILAQYEHDLTAMRSIIYDAPDGLTSSLIDLATELEWKEGLEAMILATVGNLTNMRMFKSPIHLSAMMGQDPNVVKVLLKDTPIDIRDTSNRTPLHYAAESGETTLCELFFHNNADLEASDEMGFTPLHLACREGHATTVHFLIYSGAQLDPQVESDVDSEHPEYSYSPLQLAAKHGHTSVAEMLILSGATLDPPATYILTLKLPSVLEKGLDLSVTGYQMVNGRQDHTQLEVYNTNCVLRVDFYSIVLGDPSESRKFISEAHHTEVFILQHMVQTPDLLKHPVCEALIQIKWAVLKKYIYLYLLFSTAYLTLFCYYLSLFLRLELINDVNTIVERVNLRGNVTIVVVWCALIFLALIIVVVETLRIIFSYKNVLMDVEYILDLPLLAAVPVLVPLYQTRHSWQTVICAVLAVLIAMKYVFLLGRIPMVSIYVMVFRKVSSILAQITFIFIWIVIGFGCAFHIVLSPDEEAVYRPLYVHLMKVATMVFGQVDIRGLFYVPSSQFQTAIYIMFSAFVFIVFIIILNVVVGIPLYDIQGILRESRKLLLVHQVQILHQFEAILLRGGFTSSRLKKKLTLFPEGNKCIKVFPNEKEHSWLTENVQSLFWYDHPDNLRDGEEEGDLYFPAYLFEKETLEKLAAIATKNHQMGQMRFKLLRDTRNRKDDRVTVSSSVNSALSVHYKAAPAERTTEDRLQSREEGQRTLNMMRPVLSATLQDIAVNLGSAAMMLTDQQTASLHNLEDRLRTQLARLEAVYNDKIDAIAYKIEGIILRKIQRRTL